MFIIEIKRVHGFKLGYPVTAGKTLKCRVLLSFHLACFFLFKFITLPILFSIPILIKR